jgi:hypothetical protein
MNSKEPGPIADVDPSAHQPLDPPHRGQSALAAPPARPAPVTPESARELLQELLDPGRLGTRGEAWFLAQLALVALVVAPPAGGRQLLGAAGGSLLVLGLALVLLGGTALGQYLTPVPQPRDEHELVTDGVYDLVRHPM